MSLIRIKRWFDSVEKWNTVHDLLSQFQSALKRGKQCCPTLLYSSLHFHSFAVLITIKVSTPGNIRGDKSPKLVPGTSPTVLTTQSNRSWPKMWSVPCCKGIAVGTNPWDFSLRVSNQNCTLNMFEWCLRRGWASSGNKIWRENTTAGLFVL